MELKQKREETDVIGEYSKFTQSYKTDYELYYNEMKHLIKDRPSNPNKGDFYIDKETGEFWKFFKGVWYNRGNPISHIKFMKYQQNSNKIIKKRKPKNEIQQIIKVKSKTVEQPIETSDDLIIDDIVILKTVEEQPTETVNDLIIDNIDISETTEQPIQNSDDLIIDNDNVTNDDIINIIEKTNYNDIVEKLRNSISPDPSLVEGNRFYFVIDITPSEQGNKISFDFINFISKYFVGSTIYLIGIFDSYPLDYFRKKQANVIKLQPKNKKILNSYIAFARRFYTFNYEYAKWAIEQKVNGCTLFVTDNGDYNISGLDICKIEKDVMIDIIPKNKGNILKY